MYQNYIFDFDGTIADTQNLIFETWNQVCVSENLDSPNLEWIKSMIGVGLSGIAEQILLQNLVEKLTDSQTDRLVQKYKQIYDNNFTKISLFDGILDCLEGLKNTNKKLFVASAKGNSALHKSIKHLGIENYFVDIVGADDVQNIKPHQEALELLVQKYSLIKAECLMIGDAFTDIQMGKNANIDTYGVSWGCSSLTQMETFEPLYLVQNPNQIISLKQNK